MQPALHRPERRGPPRSIRRPACAASCRHRFPCSRWPRRALWLCSCSRLFFHILSRYEQPDVFVCPYNYFYRLGAFDLVGLGGEPPRCAVEVFVLRPIPDSSASRMALTEFSIPGQRAASGERRQTPPGKSHAEDGRRLPNLRETEREIP